MISFEAVCLRFLFRAAAFTVVSPDLSADAQVDANQGDYQLGALPSTVHISWPAVAFFG
jgi:hypothetical protein